MANLETTIPVSEAVNKTSLEQAVLNMDDLEKLERLIKTGDHLLSFPPEISQELTVLYYLLKGKSDLQHLVFNRSGEEIASWLSFPMMVIILLFLPSSLSLNPISLETTQQLVEMRYVITSAETLLVSLNAILLRRRIQFHNLLKFVREKKKAMLGTSLDLIYPNAESKES